MLHYNTVSDLLSRCLKDVMAAEVFKDFRLVGGTALSLQLGHRISVDIDLFTDAQYGSIDFGTIDQYLESNYEYASHSKIIPVALGKSYIVGSNQNNAIKLDIYYTDTFIQPAFVVDKIRMATLAEIVAMKIDVIQRNGRKKDFWDIHELLKHFSIDQMLALHQSRYEYNHDRNLILENMTNFGFADEDLEPICLRGKYWAFIKEDITDAVRDYLYQ